MSHAAAAPELTNYAPTTYAGLQAAVKQVAVPNFRYAVYEVAISENGPVVDRFEVFQDAIGWVVWSAGWASERQVSARSEYANSLPSFIGKGLGQHMITYPAA